MKRKTDPRHINRIKVMQELFSWEFQPGKLINLESKEIVKDLEKIDKLIAKSAPDRPIEQINKIDLAILRLAVFELIIKKEAPPKVIVDEAVELGKEYGSDSSPAFINGALGQAIKTTKIKI